MREKTAKKTRDWAIVLFYTLFIYISLPVMPDVWAWFMKYTGRFADYSAAFILAAFGVYALSYLIARQKHIQRFICLAILGFAYALSLSQLKLPVERIHFIEYGLLSLFVFRALRHNIKNTSIYLWSGIIVFCLGLLDEGIQYILPNRVYDTRDVIANGLAGALGLALIGLCFQPE